MSISVQKFNVLAHISYVLVCSSITSSRYKYILYFCHCHLQCEKELSAKNIFVNGPMRSRDETTIIVYWIEMRYIHHRIMTTDEIYDISPLLFSCYNALLRISYSDSYHRGSTSHHSVVVTLSYYFNSKAYGT